MSLPTINRLMKNTPTMSSRAFTAVRLPITGSNSTDRAYPESKRLTRRVAAELKSSHLRSETMANQAANRVMEPPGANRRMRIARPGISVRDHCLNVGCAASAW